MLISHHYKAAEQVQNKWLQMIYEKCFKRVIDIIISCILFVITFPILVLAFIILYFSNNSSVFFVQNRPGKDEKIFNLIKFKTMNDSVDDQGNLNPDERRMTKIGKTFRQLSIDELPQLINVLKGEMSLIGPRPLLVEYLPLYNSEQKKRHYVKPGITGWAQVNGRNTLSWEEKLRLDSWYVDNISFLLDIKIVFMTIMKIVKSEGITSKTSATMEKFTGNN